MMWHFTAEYAPQGDLGRFNNRQIARGMEWKRSADKLVEALIDCGWLDVDPDNRLVVHDWEDHMDEATKKKLERRKQRPIGVPRGDGVIYFVRCGDAIKIGFTAQRVEARMDELQTGAPAPLELLGTYPGTRSQEAAVHSKFGKIRSHGEWFTCSDMLLDFIGLKCKSVDTPSVRHVDAVEPRARALPEPGPEPLPEPLPEPEPQPPPATEQERALVEYDTSRRNGGNATDWWSMLQKLWVASGKALCDSDWRRSLHIFLKYPGEEETIFRWAVEEFKTKWRDQEHTPLPQSDKALGSEGWRRVAMPRKIPTVTEVRQATMARRIAELQANGGKL